MNTLAVKLILMASLPTINTCNLEHMTFRSFAIRRKKVQIFELASLVNALRIEIGPFQSRIKKNESKAKFHFYFLLALLSRRQSKMSVFVRCAMCV